MSGLEALYQELILEHSKRPHGKRASASWGSGAEPQVEGVSPLREATSHQRNPICGDEISLRVRLNPDDTVHDIAWDGAGCSISQASASMLAVLVDDASLNAPTEGGMPQAAASTLIDGFRTAMRSRGTIALDEDTYGDAEALSGVSKYSARVKCAMLAWVALEDAFARAI